MMKAMLSLSSPVAAAAVPALRFVWHPVEIESVPAAPSPALAGKRIVIINGRPDTARRVAAAVAGAEATVTVFSPAADQEMPAAAHALVQQAGPFDGIIDLGLEAEFSLVDASLWEAPMRRSVAFLQAHYNDWLNEEDTSRLFYLAVTWIDGRMGYGAGRSACRHEQPLGGLWAGLAKTLPQELPNCNVRVLDLAPDEAAQVEQRIVAELYRWGRFEVGYHAGRRYSLAAQRSDLRPDVPAAIGPGDVVLFSGGARGIGQLCARAIAERCGATVIVTGRDVPPAGHEPWARLDAAAFKRYGQEQLRLATPQRPPVLIRQELLRLQRRRGLRATLDDLAARGLPVHYRVCDVTDAAAVHALCDEFGTALRVVIHNAGIDRPVRLLQKSADSFVDTVRIKVQGFVNLWSAVAGRSHLLQFCNVGSLTGRYGGMTGETDYAAANEGLARLGFWAQRNALSCAVKTLAWPTWDGVGMITNLDVTRRYTTPMALDEGVDHWLRELADSRGGEVMFMGAVGRALTPLRLKGLSPIFELPNIRQLITLDHHVGTPLRFRPFAALLTSCRIDADTVPALNAFLLDGHRVPSLGLLLEHVCALGDWVMPEGFTPLELTAISGLSLHLDAWAALGRSHDAAGSIEWLSEALGSQHGPEWRVLVRCMHAGTQQEVLRATLVYAEAGTSSAIAGCVTQPLSGEAQHAPTQAPLTRARWNGNLLRAASWQLLMNGPAAGTRVGCAAAIDASDVWALPCPPQLRLPLNHLENALRAAWAHQAGREFALQGWRIGRIAVGGADPARAQFIVQHSAERFSVVDSQGNSMLEMSGLIPQWAKDESTAASAASKPLSSAIGAFL